MRMLFCLLVLIGCYGNNSDIQIYSVDKSDFEHVINKKQVNDQKINFANYKTLLNRDYPIEVAIFEDGSWYYDLPNLGEGKGTWKYDGGSIKLHAERNLFDMNIDIMALKEKASEIGISFTDRFGYQILKAEKINIDSNN